MYRLQNRKIKLCFTDHQKNQNNVRYEVPSFRTKKIEILVVFKFVFYFNYNCSDPPNLKHHTEKSFEIKKNLPDDMEHLLHKDHSTCKIPSLLPIFKCCRH